MGGYSQSGTFITIRQKMVKGVEMKRRGQYSGGGEVPMGEMPTDLVLVPGLMLDQRMWAGQVSALPRGIAVHYADRTRHDDIAASARAILEAAPPKFALAGFSQGGCVALEIYKQAPERVSRIALMDTNHKADSAETRQFRLAGIERVRRGEFDAVMEEFLPKLLSPKAFADAKLRRAILEMAHALGPEVYIRQQTAILNRPDYRAVAAAIHVPALVLCGGEDTITPPSLHEEMAARIAGAALEVIEGAGHMTTLERPKTVARVMLKWLER